MIESKRKEEIIGVLLLKEALWIENKHSLDELIQIEEHISDRLCNTSDKEKKEMWFINN